MRVFMFLFFWWALLIGQRSPQTKEGERHTHRNRLHPSANKITNKHSGEESKRQRSQKPNSQVSINQKKKRAEFRPPSGETPLHKRKKRDSDR